jgi:hypothetical protein
MCPTAVYRGKPDHLESSAGRTATIKLHGVPDAAPPTVQILPAENPRTETRRRTGAADPELRPRTSLLLLQSTYIASADHIAQSSRKLLSNKQCGVSAECYHQLRRVRSHHYSHREHGNWQHEHTPVERLPETHRSPAARRSNHFQKLGRPADVDLDLSTVPRKDTDNHRFNIPSTCPASPLQHH